MILRLQTEEELVALQDRIRAKSTVRVHESQFSVGRGTEAQKGGPPSPKSTPRARHKRLGAPKPSLPERDIQKAILRFLRGHSRVAWVERLNTGRRGKVSYGFVGCSDLLGQLRDGKLLAVECKARGGKVTPDQHTFLSKVTLWGGVAGVCYSVDDVRSLLATG